VTGRTVNRGRKWPSWGLAACSIAYGALAIVSGAVAGPADGDPETDRPGQTDIERLRELHHTEQEQVRLVQVPAVVTNRRGKMVHGLEKSDFLLYEDYVPQTIKYINTETDQPVAIAFLLDVSGSMRQAGKLEEAKEAIGVFVNELQEGDLIGLVCFADDQVAWVTDFTSDRNRFLRRLGVQEGYGQTALFDALAATPQLVDEKVKGSKAIVLFTDGVDTASTMSTFDSLQLARSVNVPIYAVGFASFASRVIARGGTPQAHRTVELFADETGGRLFPVYDPDDLKEVVLEIQSELRFRYLISYRPTRRLWDGTFRRIKLETVNGGLSVRARTGYYANP